MMKYYHREVRGKNIANSKNMHRSVMKDGYGAAKGTDQPKVILKAAISLGS